MAVSLVHGGVGTEKIEVPATLRVPRMNSFGSFKDYGDRMVRLCCVLVLPFY